MSLQVHMAASPVDLDSAMMYSPPIQPKASGSQSPSSPRDISVEVPARSRLPRSSSSKSTSPVTPVSPPTISSRKVKGGDAAAAMPRLAKHLERAEDRALRTFEQIEENGFQSKALGRSHQQEEMMICDCSFDPDEDDPDDACGLHSNCINRMTQVECLQGQCQTRGHCQNQRFSRKQYADIDIVQTEKKGFGVRAAADLPAETFVYEYIGEVISETMFRKRIRDYADEGIEHFYFMMLQKEEYLDATKKGGLARFLNHSCDPNCYVAKWVVGKRMRMGIFTKRKIMEGEELTFNYNVDRYGYDAQICYCGEPVCSGFIGGKTQTDLGAMDELYLDALGISEEVTTHGLKGNKKRKSRKLDEDFTPVLQPMEEDDVPKVVAALRQATANRMMLVKLLQRVQMTNDEVALKEIMRMHGFSLMWNILNTFIEDEEIVELSLETMQTWKVGNRIKIEDSKIEEVTRRCAELENEVIRAKADQLLLYWKDRPSVFRIPRRVHVPDTADDEGNGESEATTLVYDKPRYASFTDSAPKAVAFIPAPIAAPTVPFRPRIHTPVALALPSPTSANPLLDKSRLEAILAQAQLNQEAAAREAMEAAMRQQILAATSAAASGSKRRGGSEGYSNGRWKRVRLTEEEKGERREKKLNKVVGEFVVHTMSKYSYMMERETFKRYAKECTSVLVQKEKRGKSYQDGAPIEKLSEEKRAKMKVFVKEFTHKILKKLKERGKLLSRPESSTPITSTSSFNSPSSHSQQHRRRDSDIRNGSHDHGSQGSHSPRTGPGADLKQQQLVDEMFGRDDHDDDVDMEEDDQDMDEDDTQSVYINGLPLPARTFRPNGGGADIASIGDSSVSTPPLASPFGPEGQKPDMARIVRATDSTSPSSLGERLPLLAAGGGGLGKGVDQGRAVTPDTPPFEDYEKAMNGRGDGRRH